MCYRFELLEFEDCLFQNVDATYILHLEGNGRLDHIHEQLKTYHPSKKVYIVYNKGYKKCEKNLDKQTSGYDLIHANMTVFEHAKQYKHVLVLEDDFIFSKDVKKYAHHVDDFLKRDSFVYKLGCLPVFAFPVDWYHYHDYSGTAHSNIYSSSSRKIMLDDYILKTHTFEHMDAYVARLFTTYMFYKPLCYQIFPKTENRKIWTKNVHPILKPIFKTVSDTIISCTNLENEPEPGFSIIYFLAKIIPFVLFFLLLWIISHFSSLSCTSLKGKRVR
jgi:hypothetical protein